MSQDQEEITLTFPKDHASEVFKAWALPETADEATGTHTVSAFVAGPAIAMILAGQNPSKDQARRSVGYWLEEVGETLDAMGFSTEATTLKRLAKQLKSGEIGLTPGFAPEKNKLIDGLVDSTWTSIGALYAMLGESGGIMSMQRVLIANAKKFPNGQAIIDPETKKYKKPDDWVEPEFYDIPCVDLT